MNAPLRRVAISVLVLFTLLILNVNYIQVVRSDELRKNTSNTRVLAAEYDRERGAIIVAGEPVALSVPTDGRLRYLRTYPQAGLYAAVTGYYSLIFTIEGIERAENDILSGEDPRLAFRRLADMFTGRDPAGGDVVLTLDPAVQEAAMAGLEGVTGGVVALDPSSGAVLGLASTPTYDPTLLSSHDPDAIREYAAQLDAIDPDPRRNQATREIPKALGTFPTSDLQGDRVGRRTAGGVHAGHGGACPGRVPAAQQLPGHSQLQRLQLQQHRRAVAHRRADHLLQHRLRHARHRAG